MHSHVIPLLWDTGELGLVVVDEHGHLTLQQACVRPEAPALPRHPSPGVAPQDAAAEDRQKTTRAHH